MDVKVLKEEFNKDKILIWGMGLEGRSTYNLIRKINPSGMLYLADDKDIDIKGFSNVEFNVSENIKFDEYDLIIKSPGVVIKDPSFPFDKLTSQTEIFLKHFRKQVIGITGTKGKSTTSSLTYSILKKAGLDTILVGNIGIPCFDAIEKMSDKTIVVFEISCHQLEYATYSPHISVLLNLYPEHLDHYGTFEKYIKAKENVFVNQDENDLLIINNVLKDQKDKAHNFVTIGEDGDIQIKENTITFDSKTFTIHHNDTNLIGKHNLFNSAIAIYIASKIYNVDDKAVLSGLREFKPLEHRIEVVGEYDGVKYVNDSISTIPEATILAIKALNDVDTVLIGGMDRHISYEKLAKYLHETKVDNIILMYESGKRIYEEYKDTMQGNVYLVKDLDEACALAKKVCAKGKICLLSPAAASYGYFKNFEERGTKFKTLVKTNE